MTEAAALTACMMGGRFGLITFGNVEPYRELIARHGLSARLAALAGLDATPPEALANPEGVAEKLRMLLAEPMLIDGHRLQVTPSIGIALIPDHGATPADLLKRADIALYRAKDSGRNTVQLFRRTMQEAASERLRLENDLRLADHAALYHALRQCIAAVRRGGTVSVPGVYAGFIHGFLFGDAFDKGLTFKMGQTHVQKLMPELLDHIAEGNLDPGVIVTHRMPLEEAAKGYEIFDRKQEDCRKVILTP